LFEITSQNRHSLVICQIGHRHSRGYHAKPRIEGGKLAQKRLEARLA